MKNGVILSVLVVTFVWLFLFTASAFAVEIIIDNTDLGFSIVSGTWPDSTSVSGYYGTNYKTNEAGIGNDKVKWTPNIPVNGYYEIFAWWTSHSNRASDAPYTIYNGVSTTIDVDQKVNGSQWNKLGTFYLTAGTSNYVELSDDANGYVIADAVKFVSLPTPSTVYVDDDYNETACAAAGHLWLYDCFDKIQDGINAVIDSGTVNIAAGVYNNLDMNWDGRRFIYINKPLKLKGAGSSLTILDGEHLYSVLNPGPGPHCTLIWIENSNVTLEGLTVKGCDWGIRVTNVDVPAKTELGDFEFKDVVITDNYGHGVVFETYTDVIFKRVEFTNCKANANGDRGIYFSPKTKSENIVLNNMEASHNLKSGFNCQGTMTGLTITGGTFNNNTGGLNKEGNGPYFGVGIELENCVNCNLNGITANENGLLGPDDCGDAAWNTPPFSMSGGAGVLLKNATSNVTILNSNLKNNANGLLIEWCKWWPTVSEPNNIVIKNSKIIGNIYFGVSNRGPSNFVNATYNFWGSNSGPSGVGPGSGDAVSNNVYYNPWLKLSEAWVDDNYNETACTTAGHTWQIDCFDDIQGAIDVMGGSTIHVYAGTYGPFYIVDKSDLFIDGSGSVNVTGKIDVNTEYGVRSTIIFVRNSQNITIDGLNIEGQSGNEARYGAIFQGSTGIFKNGIISPNNVITHSNGCAAGIWGAGSDFGIFDSELKNFGKVGAFWYGEDVKGSINESTVKCNVFNDSSRLSNGIEVEYGAHAIIDHNEVYDCRNLDPSPSWDSIGILIHGWGDFGDPSVYPVASAVITRNRIHNNDYGIFIGEYGSGTNIEKNYIRNNVHGIWVRGSANTIVMNDISNNIGATGVHLDTTSSNNILYKNNFNNNDPQAVDDGTNQWDDGVSKGNYWSDWRYNVNYPASYLISGTAGAIDHFAIGPQYAISSASARNGVLNWLKSGSVNLDGTNFSSLRMTFSSTLIDKNNVPKGYVMVSISGTTTDGKRVTAMFMASPNVIYKHNSNRVYAGGPGRMYIYVFEKYKLPIIIRGNVDSLRFDIQNGNLVNVAAGNGPGMPDDVLRITGMNAYRFSFREFGYSPYYFLI